MVWYMCILTRTSEEMAHNVMILSCHVPCVSCVYHAFIRPTMNIRFAFTTGCMTIFQVESERRTMQFHGD